MTDIINYLTKICFGTGSVSDLSQELKLLGISKPLFVTDRVLNASGMVQSVVKEAGFCSELIFEGTPENPTEAAVLEALDAFTGLGCDGIVSIGGGSCIDLAKGVSILGTHDGDLRQYAVVEGGLEKIKENTVPHIAIPTTAGTGSEVGRAALITLSDNRKLGLISPYLIPSVAICDPNLTKSLPPRLTAATGMDAISHCVETYLSPRNNPPAEAIALDGLRRAMAHLHDAVEDGSNMTARSEMMMAALEGAMAFQKGLGAVHSISHALGGYKGLKLHHGTLNAVLLPPVLRFNKSHCEEKYARMISILNLPVGTDLAAVFEKLNSDMGIPDCLEAMGVPADIFDTIAQWSFEDHSTVTNPRPVTVEDFKAILQEVA